MISQLSLAKLTARFSRKYFSSSLGGSGSGSGNPTVNALKPAKTNDSNSSLASEGRSAAAANELAPPCLVRSKTVRQLPNSHGRTVQASNSSGNFYGVPREKRSSSHGYIFDQLLPVAAQLIFAVSEQLSVQLSCCQWMFVLSIS